MKRTDLVLISLVVLLVAAQAVSAAAATPGPARQSKRRAERNVLGATRVLARWQVGIVNPKSGLLRSNTTAACSGRGHAVAGKYGNFTCVLRYRKKIVRLVYTVLSGNGFEVRRLRRR